jgi:isocitrate dehydrogenase (NAD+)
MLLAAALMLDHVALADPATHLRAAVLRTLHDNVRTRDLGGTASTRDFTSAIVARLGDQGS